MANARRVLVVGASRGLGLGLCEAFREAGDEVIGTSRSAAPALTAAGVRAIAGIDVAAADCGDRVAAELPADGIDVLVYNAAINDEAADLAGVDAAAIARHLEINALGAVRVVLGVLPLLREGAKIMLVGNGIRALNLGGAGPGNYGYRMSKAALVSFGCGLGRDLRERGIAVLLASPGPVDTDMLREAVEAGRTSFELAKATPADLAGRLLRDQLDRLTLADSPAWNEDLEGTPVAL